MHAETRKANSMQTWDSIGDVEHTPRGFEVIYFDDHNNQACRLQQSSATGNREEDIERPGTSFVWLGAADYSMHLNRQQAAAIAKLLSRWVATGSFECSGDSG